MSNKKGNNKKYIVDIVPVTMFPIIFPITTNHVLLAKIEWPVWYTIIIYLLLKG